MSGNMSSNAMPVGDRTQLRTNFVTVLLNCSEGKGGRLTGIKCFALNARSAGEKKGRRNEMAENISEWLEDSDPGQEYGTTWACAECGCSIHERIVWNPYRAGFKYCPFCGDRMVLKRND